MMMTMNISLMDAATYLVAAFLLSILMIKFIKRKKCSKFQIIITFLLYFLISSKTYGIYTMSLIYIISIVEAGILTVICLILFNIINKIMEVVKCLF